MSKLFKMVSKRIGVIKKNKLKIKKTLGAKETQIPFVGDRSFQISAIDKKTGDSVAHIFSSFSKKRNENFIAGTGTKTTLQKKGIGFDLMKRMFGGGRSEFGGNLVTEEGKRLRNKFPSDFRYISERTVGVNSTGGKLSIKRKGKSLTKTVSKKNKKTTKIKFVRIRGRIVPMRSKK